MNKLKMNLIKLISLCLTTVLLVSCGKSDEAQTNSESLVEDTEVATGIDEEERNTYIDNESLLNVPHLILSVDTTEQSIMLKDMKNNRQLLYYYNLNTVFYDKYKGLTGVTSFLPGKVCVIIGTQKNGLISEIMLSPEVWEYDQLTEYKIDIARGIFTVGETNFRITADVPVFSGNTLTDLNALGKNDTIRITGQDKDIWSVVITTGHGYLSLMNTNVFNGSLICVGDIYTLLNGDVTMEVPEGTYNIVLANKGYGGNATVDIPRGGYVVLDLDAIKSQEIKYCNLTFNIEVADAVIKIDGNEVNRDVPFSIEYGRHNLTVSAPGYDSWTKYLYVNSPEATIMLTMDDEDTKKPESSTGTDKEEEKKDETSSDSTTDADKEKEKEKVELDYLTTIRDTVSSIMNSLSL